MTNHINTKRLKPANRKVDKWQAIHRNGDANDLNIIKTIQLYKIWKIKSFCLSDWQW